MSQFYYEGVWPWHDEVRNSGLCVHDGQPLDASNHRCHCLRDRQNEVSHKNTKQCKLEHKTNEKHNCQYPVLNPFHITSRFYFLAHSVRLHKLSTACLSWQVQSHILCLARCKSTCMQLIWTVSLPKLLSSRHLFSDNCALGHMWATSSNPGLCGDGWTPVNTWYSLSRTKGGQGVDKIHFHRAVPKHSTYQLSLTILRSTKKALSYRVHSMICFLLYKMPLILVLELRDSIVFDVASFDFRPPSPLLWFCSFQWESSSWLLCSTMSNSSGT